jgi:mono/diheme cytochrome c family protein
LDQQVRRIESKLVLGLQLVCLVPAGTAGQEAANSKFYTVIDGKADTRTLTGFRRYHAGCNNCHGAYGEGSTFAPSLIADLPRIEAFTAIVLQGRRNGNSVMKGFAGDPNFEPYLKDIYAYLQARSDGVLGRGRPAKLKE